MLSNNILLNQSVNEPKRDHVVNKSNGNDTERNFQDAMSESRQQQLNTEQRQDAARNAQARQQQRREQEQTNSPSQSKVQSSAETDNKTAASSDDKVQSKKDKESKNNETSETSSTNKSVKNEDADKAQLVNSLDSEGLDTDNFNSEQSENVEDISPLLLATKTDEDTAQTENENIDDDMSWLDTVIKIVVDHKEKNDSELAENSSDDSLADLPINKIAELGELGTDKLFDNESTINESISNKQITNEELNEILQSSEPEELQKLLEELTSLKSEQSSQVDKQDELSVLSSLLTSNLSETDSEGEALSDESSDITSDVNTNSETVDKSITDNIDLQTLIAQMSSATQDVSPQKNGSELVDANDDKDSELDVELDLTSDNSQVFANLAAQQQTQNSDSIKQGSLLEQATKSSNVLSFTNPTLQGLVKSNNMGDEQVNKFSLDVNTQTEGLPDIDTESESKLDSQEKSLLDIRTAALMSNTADTTGRLNESGQKTDVVEINGVQLDKTLELPKLENVSQAKSETLIRENILFNKQEMANHMQQQIGMMLSKNMKSIDIRLDPPDLGTIQVKLTMNNEQASVSFVVSNQQAKDALDASLPRLKDMLEQQGMELADSDVQQGNARGESDASDSEDGSDNTNGTSGDSNEDDAHLVAQEQLNRSINSPWNVDYYA